MSVLPDYVRRVPGALGERFHEFLQADGSWKRCGHTVYCRECRKENAERAAAQAAKTAARREKKNG